MATNRHPVGVPPALGPGRRIAALDPVRVLSAPIGAASTADPTSR